MHNTQENLKEEKKYTQELEVTTNQLREDVIDIALELCDRDDMIPAKDTLIASLMHWVRRKMEPPLDAPHSWTTTLVIWV